MSGGHTTSRVRLQRATRADRADLVAANQASASYHAPWASPFTDDAGFDRWYADLITGANVGLVGRRADDGAVVGVFTFSQIVMGLFRSAYLGFYGVAGQAGRGLMTEALGQASDFAFRDIGLHRIEANIQPGNHRSIALVRRAGFAREGLSPRYLFIDGAWRDHERWALLDDRQ